MMSSSQQDRSRRAGRLKGIFRAILAGGRPVRSPADATIFIEAMTTSQPSPGACVEDIMHSKPGLDAYRDAVRADLSPLFITDQILGKVVPFLSDPCVGALAEGQFLRQLLVALAAPPTVWNAALNLFHGGQIPEASLGAFAWLTLALLSLPLKAGVDVLADVQAVVERKTLRKAAAHEARDINYKIEKVLRMKLSPSSAAAAAAGNERDGPGGRHDNDFPNFREISIYPTTDELLSKQTPFYRRAAEAFETIANVEERTGVHVDNQYRLLREDMLAELRDDLQVATGRKWDGKRGGRQACVLGRLVPCGIDFGEEKRSKKCALKLKCYDGLQQLQKRNPDARRNFLKSNQNVLRNQSFGALCRDKDVCGFAFVDRDIDLLAQSPPIVSLQFTDRKALHSALHLFKSSSSAAAVKFVIVDTPVFAYAPVLEALKEINDLPLHKYLLDAKCPVEDFEPVPRLKVLADTLENKLRMAPANSKGTFELADSDVRVDESQLKSVISALTRPVSIIQGPPGTGKSFIGAHIAKEFHHGGQQRILVISYTNHALDQFMEDLVKVGIPKADMVRLGSKHKCTPETADIVLSELKGSIGYTRSRGCWAMINVLNDRSRELGYELGREFTGYLGLGVAWNDLSEYLELSLEDRKFYDAFLVPSEQDGFARVGSKKKMNKEVDKSYLFDRWKKGQNPGIFVKELCRNLGDAEMGVWSLSPDAREAHVERWKLHMLGERIEAVLELVRQYDDVHEQTRVQLEADQVAVVKSRRVIGCTTTAAAKYSGLIRAASPDVVIVEEAGEILESHVLTALSPTAKHLVLIGDHKQLRPKVNNYALTVEKGTGFDLNRSLFERLILQGAPHITLTKQHRMVPGISEVPRRLTYPALVDGAGTRGRPPIRGLQDRIVFFNHGHPEDNIGVGNHRDPESKSSKKNAFEAQIVLKCVRFLGQQGYSTKNVVVLTPYAGQLSVLKTLLESDVDPLLSDMDKHELVRAGLMSQASAEHDKQQLRLSTIDNYQGEESDIAIISLTRSNSEGDIGFMWAPERLNVLTTRARNGVIYVGNMATFVSSKKGKETWHPFFEILQEKGHLYDGLPVKCEKHPDRTSLIKEPDDFEKFCPDGGCTELCGAPLSCGFHTCRLRCHRISDHSKFTCQKRVERMCQRGHKSHVLCSRREDGCHECIREDKENERRIQRDLQLEVDRLARQAAYRKELEAVKDEIDREKRLMQYQREMEEQEKTLSQQTADLEAMKETRARLQEQKKRKDEAAIRQKLALQTKNAEAGKQEKAGPDDQKSRKEGGAPGTAGEEWARLKKFEGAKNQSLDTLMDMIGLEDVKKEFLSIKSRVDMVLRQGVSLGSDRFGCSLLGNPGTGKTTVARIYGQFLSSVGVIPGSVFKEVTGASLANQGVGGCQKLIDDMLNDGGGVLFVDEAYQLTSGNNPGGSAVLDYLLAKVENLTGKIVFVLAGYRKQMETFFAHNPGLPSRFPVDMSFADYTDDELLRILGVKIEKRYGEGRMKCEGDEGLSGLYCRIVARRVGRGRGREGFGNARTVENTLVNICKRQADRVRRERSAGDKPDDFLFTREDLIGPEPKAALTGCVAWRKLQGMIGLGAVKEAIRALVDSIQQNYQRELAEKPHIDFTLNKVFLGQPGTGKTTVAKLYGEILGALGLLSTKEVVVKNPSDFVGGVLGASEQQTKGILASTLGKVLVIDEAYGLYGGGGSGGNSYKTAVIDTIVAEVQSVPGDDRCVLLLGYKDQMEEMFQNVNPGLARRFPAGSAFNFEDFSDDELRQILDLKLKQQGFQATGQAKDVAMEKLALARNRPNFGNAGEVDILLNDAKTRHQTRFSKGEAKAEAVLEARDIDADFDRAERSSSAALGTNVRQLFRGTVGAEATVALLEGYQETVRTMKDLGMDPRENIPFNFLFRGPPGTGKTTTANKMGKVFYDMGFLATAEVVTCSASDLVGQFVGQTGPKVRQLLDKALGRVLFIDEAYRLAEGHFAQEAIDELVDCVTKERYQKKLIIILAGYEKDINRLMAVNPGLTSRFPDVVEFRSLTPGECVGLLELKLKEQRKKMEEKSRGKNTMVLGVLGRDGEGVCTRSGGQFVSLMTGAFDALAKQDSWASARDVETLAKAIFAKTIKSRRREDGGFVVSEAVVLGELDAMLRDRRSRSDAPTFRLPLRVASPNQPPPPPPPTAPPQTLIPMAIATATSTRTQQQQQQQQQQHKCGEEIASVEEEEEREVKTKEEVSWRRRPFPGTRDAGVSDVVWAQLQSDWEAGQDREEEYQRLKAAQRQASNEARDRITRRLMEEEKRRKEEEAVRKKIAAAGRCPVGYEWIKQAAGGYRCTGGSHYLSEGETQTLMQA